MNWDTCETRSFFGILGRAVGAAGGGGLISNDTAFVGWSQDQSALIKYDLEKKRTEQNRTEKKKLNSLLSSNWNA